MPVERRFLIARSFARLIRKERGTVGRAVEGYFATSAERVHFVSIAAGRCELVLTRSEEGAEPVEERTEVPRTQAEALLDICAGKLAFDRTALLLDDGREVFIDRVMTTGALNVITVPFEEGAAGATFAPPLWFGAEITDEPAYTRRAVALEGLKAMPSAGVSDSALDALLDTLEGRGSVRPSRPAQTQNLAQAPAPAPAPAYASGPARTESERRVSEAFRRLAVVAQTPTATRGSASAQEAGQEPTYEPAQEAAHASEEPSRGTAAIAADPAERELADPAGGVLQVEVEERQVRPALRPAYRH